MPISASKLGAALPGGAALGAEMHAHRLGDLAADRQRRIERRCGVLEHHADAAAAQGGGVAQQIVAVEGETSRLELRRRAEQAEQRQHDGRLARSRFAHESQHAAGRDGERHVVQRLQPARARRVGDRQRLDLQRSAGGHRLSGKAASGMPATAEMRVEAFAQAFAHEVDRDQQHAEAKAGREADPRRLRRGNRGPRRSSGPIRWPAAAGRGRGTTKPSPAGWRRSRAGRTRR